MLSWIKRLFKIKKIDYKELTDRGALIIDVRTISEFTQGHMNKSSNIPLSEIGRQIEQIKKQDKPVITCCASGIRSAKAAMTLRRAGIEAYNGGSWKQVERSIKEL